MIGGPSVSVLTAEEIRVLFRVSDVRTLADLLPHDLYADADDGGRAASPEDFGLEGLGFGGSAVVMAHPDDPSRVLRVCEEADGWVAYACGGEPNIHKPTVFALGWTGVCWVAVSERLDPASGEAGVAFTDSLLSAVQPARKAEPTTPEMVSLMADVQDRHLLLDDIEPRNILRRSDGMIVLNDQVSFMSVSHIRDFKDRFAVADEAALTM